MPREILVNDIIDDILEDVKIIKLNTYLNTEKQVYSYFLFCVWCDKMLTILVKCYNIT